MEDWHWAALTVAATTLTAYWMAARKPAKKPAEAALEAAVAPDAEAPKVKAEAPKAKPGAAAVSERPPPSSVVPSKSPASKAKAESSPSLPKLGFEEDDGLDATRVGVTSSDQIKAAPTAKIIYDEDAAIDEPTQDRALILVSAMGQTDKGLRRRHNEDSVLLLQEKGLFVVADGMGGYRGGEVASGLAVKTIEDAFDKATFEGPVHDTIPPRASELARAIQMANSAILSRASQDKQLEGMGTTISAARFSPNKQRLYVGHVGDSRVYCLRDGRLKQMTSDHTMADLGVRGDAAHHLSRAAGIWPVVPVDIILGKPRAGDVYMLCSDGLTKMVSDAEIEAVLRELPPERAVEKLISAANGMGGKDNITIVVVKIEEPTSTGAAA